MTRLFLAGAGPGDPDLLTVKTLRILREADIVLHDSLVSDEILALANPAATLIDVGKRCGRHSATQDAICAMLVQAAQTGGLVLRLKGGDPMLFGRATEEMLALDAHGVAYEVIPGISAALAAAAALKRSLTQRCVSRAVHFVAGHTADGDLPGHDFAALAQKGGTLAIYMGARTFAGFAAHLIEAGMAPAVPAIAIENVSCPGQITITATLGTLPARLARETRGGPVLILLGEALGDAALPSLALREFGLAA